MKYYNYVNGLFIHFEKQEETESKDQNYFSSINPSTEEVIADFPRTTTEEVTQAVKAARKALPAWRALSRVKRAECFERLVACMQGFQDVITEVISKETGKSLNESKAEFNEAVHMAQYTFAQGREPFGQLVASEIAEKDIFVFRKPKGVVAVISPWNFPFAIGGFWTSAPALLEGNTVVFKPSEDTPHVGWLIAHLYQQAGFPAGVFNVIHGDGHVGAALVADDVNHICFTGSAQVGQYIQEVCAKSGHKTCSCEMGSKSAVIVCEDADMDLAVNCCVSSAYKLSGQRCVSAGRLIVDRKIIGEFTEKFVEATKKVTIGDPLKGEFFFGPLINKSQVDRVCKYNELTYRGDHKPHVKVLLSGKPMPGKGFFMSPHVYTCEWADRPFLKEEVFGPHVAIIPYDTLEDAVRIYNDTEYGLSMACITKDMYKARYFRNECDYGLGYLNLPSIGAESHVNFGGVKKSGNGSPSAAGTFRAVTHEVTWTSNYQQGGFQFCQGLK
jgi:aldehyde dehydrogenase (NAD+)